MKVFVPFIFYLLISCSNNKQICCLENVLEYDTLSLSKNVVLVPLNVPVANIDSILTVTGLFGNMGFQTFEHNNDPYIAFVKKEKDSIVFVNVFNQALTKTVKTPSFYQTKGKYVWKIKNDTLHIIDILKFTYFSVPLDSGFHYGRTKVHELSGHFKNKEFLNTNILVEKKIDIQYPYLLLSFGTFKNRSNMDSKAIYVINLHTNKGNKKLEYPKKYRDCDQRYYYSIIESAGNNSLDIVFKKDDHIYRMEIPDGKTISSPDSLPFRNRYRCFDLKMISNLAYTAKFDETDEDNITMLHVKGKVFVVKRLRKEKKTDKSSYVLMEYDSALNQNGAYLLNASISPGFTFPYKNGIAFYNDSLNRVYYYDVN